MSFLAPWGAEAVELERSPMTAWRSARRIYKGKVSPGSVQGWSDEFFYLATSTPRCSRFFSFTIWAGRRTRTSFVITTLLFKERYSCKFSFIYVEFGNERLKISDGESCLQSLIASLSIAS